MAGSKEWFEYHLTPRGWFIGDARFDDGDSRRRTTPSDVIITLTLTEYISCGSNLNRQITRKKVNPNISDDELSQLFKTYGEIPEEWRNS